MASLSRILIKTTIPYTADDWHVGRFSLLTVYLASLTEGGKHLYRVVPADRVVNQAGDDVDLREAARGAYDQIWIIATDVTDALTEGDISHLHEFRARGGGLLLTRDHQDLGACLARLGAVGRTQHFQSVNPENDEGRRCCDDSETPAISWPNYHSGRNGDLQDVEVVKPVHPVMQKADGAAISRLPAHPHEGAVGVPAELSAHARVIAKGRSSQSRVSFNLVVAIEEQGQGRAIADSSFHHFADYNWDPRMGCPSFVTETAGDQVLRDSAALDDVNAYVAHAAKWLAGRT